MKTTIRPSLAKHRQQEIILLEFPYDEELHEYVKSLPGARWSRSLQSWYVPDNKQYREQFGLSPKGIRRESSLYISERNSGALIPIVMSSHVFSGYP